MDLRLAEFLQECCRYVQSGSRRDRPAGVQLEFAVSGAFAHTANAAVLEFDDCRVVAFQGTTDKRDRQTFVDWAYNLRAEAVASAGFPGLVHAGFALQIRALLPLICEKLRQTDDEKPLLLTGFSQGGALAILATHALVAEGHVARATYVFAAPRVGDADFCRASAPIICRFEYGNDLVPHVPFQKPDSPLFRIAYAQLKGELPDDVVKFVDRAEEKYACYRHAGCLYYRASADDDWKEYAEAEEARLRVRRSIKLLTAGRKMYFDHALEHYASTKKTP